MAAFAQNKKREPPHFTMAKWMGIWLNTNSVVNPQKGNQIGKKSVQRHSGVAIQQVRHMWQGLHTILDYKRKASHVTDTDVLHPDKWNTFARLRITWWNGRGPLPRTVGFRSPWPTLAWLPAQTASLATSSEHAQTSFLECLRTY
jgi:hypothetical protein